MTDQANVSHGQTSTRPTVFDRQNGPVQVDDWCVTRERLRLGRHPTPYRLLEEVSDINADRRRATTTRSQDAAPTHLPLRLVCAGPAATIQVACHSRVP